MGKKNEPSVRDTLNDVQLLNNVIRTNNATTGSGGDDDPVRTIVQYWTIEGQLLDVCDPWLLEKHEHEKGIRRKKSH